MTGNNSTLLFADTPPTNGNWGKFGIEYETNGLNFWKPFADGKSVEGSYNPKSGAINYILFLNDDGNIGVGTNRPLAKLHVNGTSLFKQIGVGIDVPEADLHVVGSGIITNDFLIGDTQKPGSLNVFGTGIVTKDFTIGKIHESGSLNVFGPSVLVGTLQVSSLISEEESMIVADKDGILGLAPLPIGDQMGSHIATQNIQMRGKFITNDEAGTTEGIYIGTTGNVGIKTSSIQDIDDFTVSAPITKAAYLRVKGQSNKPAVAWLTNGNKTIGIGVDGEKGYIYENYNSNNEKVITFKDGRVGIGNLFDESNSEIPMLGDHKLFVTGGITTEEVKVKIKTTWSDYVFNSDYSLMNLTNLELFIMQNGHLPEVPDQKNVSENGIELGAMNALLLKKIEELTLYIIEQDKRIKSLENSN